MYKAHFDGSSKGNPGPSRIGFVIYDKYDNEISSFTKDVEDGTNNEAEYKALVKLCEKLWKLGIGDVTIYGDSKLVVEQINGLLLPDYKGWKIKEPRMKTLAAQVQRFLSLIPNWKLEWQPREKNSRADGLAQEGK